jgi:uncharacterized protein YgiM (DUF1202 family)
MKKILLSFVLALSVLLCGCNTDEEMQAQYDLGYADGQKAGYAEGKEAGYAEAMAELTEYPVGDYYVNTKDDPLTIRDDAAQNANKVGTIPRGEDVSVTETKSHWGFVTYDGLSGWINLDYCKEGNNPNPPAEYATEIVYVTNTGDCYHKEGCGSLWNSKIPMSLEDAEKNYRPCSKCF